MNTKSHRVLQRTTIFVLWAVAASQASSQVVYSTYLGGQGNESNLHATLDVDGNAYVTGSTGSTDFPILAALQPTNAGGVDVFVTKLSPQGEILFSTYLGGSGEERPAGIGLDGAGNVYVGGWTKSLNYPTLNALQSSYGGGAHDCFVTKLAPSGAAILYSTYFGGVADEEAVGFDVDPAGAMHIAYNLSGTYSTVTKIDPIGTSVVYTSITDPYVGFSEALAVQSNDEAMIVGVDYDHCQLGFTSSFTPTGLGGAVNWFGPCDSTAHAVSRGGAIAGVAYDEITGEPSAWIGLGNPLNPIFLGGSKTEECYAVAGDASKAAAAGYSDSPNFPVTAGAIQTSNAGGDDAFLARLVGGSLYPTYSTYLGGSSNDEATAVAVDPIGAVIVAGTTMSGDFPVTSAIQSSIGGGSDAFVVRLGPGTGGGPCGGLAIAPPVLPGGSIGVAYSQTLSANGGTPPYIFGMGSGSLPPGLSLSAAGILSGTPTTPGSYGVTIYAADAGALCGQRAYVLTVAGQVQPEDVIAGQGAGQPNPNRVRVFSGNGATTPVDFLAYSSGAFGANVSSGVIDAEDEILTGPGPGPVLGPQVRAFKNDGSSMGKVNFYAYSTLRYGARVGSAALDADAYEEILTGAGPGAVFGPHVRGFNFDASSIAAMSKVSFFSYNTLRYGVDVSSGNLDADPYAEILTAPGPGVVFASLIRGFNFDATVVTAIAKINFWAFPTPSYGASVAGGDFDGDGFGEVACANGPGTGTAFRPTFAGFNYDGTSVSALPGFLATLATGTSLGGRVGASDLSCDGVDDLLAAAGPDPAADTIVRPFHYGSGRLLALVVFAAFPGSTHGAAVSGAALGY